jgi:hypothetical protein
MKPMKKGAPKRGHVRLPVEFYPEDEGEYEAREAYPMVRPAQKNLIFSDPNAEKPADSMFAFLRPSQPREERQQTNRNLFFPEPKESSDSIFSIFSPSGKKGSTPSQEKKSGWGFFKSAAPSAPSGPFGGDPFSGAAARSEEGGDHFSFSRGGSLPAAESPRIGPKLFMSGPGRSTSLFENPAFWLMAGIGVFIALEATGVTHIGSPKQP